jgi:hypothetical protein
VESPPGGRSRSYVRFLGVGVLLLLVIGFIFIAIQAINFRRRFFAQDACRMIAYEVGDLYRSKASPTADEVDDVILRLHNASVINLRVSPEGKPLDPYGTPFRIRFAREGIVTTTRVKSAGPDGHFDTPDDIAYSDTHRPAD